MNEVRLWDGKTYQLAHIRAEFPALARYLEDSNELVEVISAPGKWASPKQQTRIMRLAMLAAVPYSAFIAWIGASGNGWSFLIWCVTTWLLMTLAGWLVYLATSVGTFRYDRTIRVENGLMTVVSGGIARQFALCDCRWFHGFGYHDGDVSQMRLSAASRRCIIICPRGWSHEYRGWPRYRCGLSEEMLQVWCEFLTAAKIPRSRTRSRYELLFIVLGLLMGLCVGSLSYRILATWLLPSPLAGPLIIYLPILFPLLFVQYASVYAGNDWYAAEPRAGRVNLAASCATLSMMSAVWYLATGYPVIAIALVPGSAGLGWGVAYDLGRHCQAY